MLQEVSICTLGPDFDQDGKVDIAKYMKIIFGQVTLSLSLSLIRHALLQWLPGLSAGGCRNDLKLFATNPQFLLTIHQVRFFVKLQAQV